jgi:hypothetical protein
LHAKLCGLKAKRAAKKFQAADIYFTRVVWTIDKSGYHTVLPAKPDWLSELGDIAVQLNGGG